jgi:hypothetical protein
MINYFEMLRAGKFKWKGSVNPVVGSNDSTGLEQPYIVPLRNVHIPTLLTESGG